MSLFGRRTIRNYSVDSFAIAAWIIYGVTTLCSGIFDGVGVHYGVLCRIIDSVRVHYGIVSTLCSGIFDGVAVSYCVYGVGLF